MITIDFHFFSFFIGILIGIVVGVLTTIFGIAFAEGE